MLLVVENIIIYIVIAIKIKESMLLFEEYKKENKKGNL